LNLAHRQIKNLYLFILLITFLACKKEDSSLQRDVFEVNAAEIGIDCQLVIIHFKAKDSEKLQLITQSEELRYHALYLDVNEYNESGIEMVVKVRETHVDEYFACSTLGPFTH
jgi:predicted RNA-binding protein associated with RNAse of E/G family